MTPEEIEAYKKLSICQKISEGSWKPSTRKDYILFTALLINIISTIVFWFLSTATFKPSYVGTSISMLILVFETAVIMICKYQAVNFHVTV